MPYNNGNVVMLATNDWTNFGAQQAKCLRSVGIYAKMFIKNNHIFNYPDQGTLFTSMNDIRSHIDNAEIIHLMHSQDAIPGASLAGKKVVVTHTGTPYRNAPQKMNDYFNKITDLTIVEGDLYNKPGNKKEVWTSTQVCNLAQIQPCYDRINKDKLVIGHNPSSGKKGTEAVKKIISDVRGDFEFRCNTNRVSWEEQQKRMSQCDIYIERFKGGSAAFGITALEAAALGKIVITTCAHTALYEKTIGPLGLISVMTPEEMKNKIEELINLPAEKIQEMKYASRSWIEKYHSYEAVGKRLINIYNRIDK